MILGIEETSNKKEEKAEVAGRSEVCRAWNAQWATSDRTAKRKYGFCVQCPGTGQEESQKERAGTDVAAADSS
jgi:hypothetical protein